VTDVLINFKMQSKFYISHRKILLQIQSLHRGNPIIQSILHFQHNLWTKSWATWSSFEVSYNFL